MLNFRRHFKLIRSTGMGFALLYASLFIVSGAIFLSFVWLRAVHAMEESSIIAIHSDADALMKDWNAGGMPLLRVKVLRRIRYDLNHENIYLLLDAHAHPIAGNISCWPEVAKRPNEDYAISNFESCASSIIELTWRHIPDGSRLLVGRDLGHTALLKRALTEALVWAAIMAFGLAIAGALAVRKLFQNIIGTVVKTTDAISNGDLTQRLPLTGSEVDGVSRTINTMLDRIAHLMDGIRNVTNSIAHDLRTPITRARNSLEDASSTAMSSDDLRRAVHQAVNELDGIKAVFDALLRIAQLESGTRRAAFKDCDLRPSLEDIADLYRPTAEERTITLHEEFPTRIPFIGDAHLIQQAVANLLDNAVKFSTPRTTICLTARLTPDMLFLSVQDQGLGMDADEIAHAAERFFRAKAAQNTPGTGLGLALVRAVAKLHHGELIFLPQTIGLRVELRLPRS